MRIKHRFTFLKEQDTNNIVNNLSNKGISYTLSSGIPFITFEIFEDEKVWDEVNVLMAKHNILSLKECLYSKEEYNNAAWFLIRCKWRWEYPQPENQFEYKQLTYDSSNYCNKCGCGLNQRDSFKIKKSPNWGKRNFLLFNWVEDELFINSDAEVVLLKHNLKGFLLKDVKNVKTNKPIDDIKQIYVNDILEPGIVNQNNTILSETKCNACGCSKIIITGRGVIFDKEVFRYIKNDIIKSYEVFGDGHMCARMIFVSRNLYKAMMESGLGKDLIFEPVMLI